MRARAVRRHEARDVVEVLDTHGDAIEGAQTRAGLRACLGGLGLRERRLLEHEHVGVRLPVRLLDAREDCLVSSTGDSVPAAIAALASAIDMYSRSVLLIVIVMCGTPVR